MGNRYLQKEEAIYDIASKQGGTAGNPVPYEMTDFIRDGIFLYGCFLTYCALKALCSSLIFENLIGAQGVRLLRDEWDR